MFLICNGILAFLVRTLNFNNSNSSTLSVLDVNGNDSSLKITEVNGLEPEPESSPENVAPGDDEEEKHPAPVEAAVAVADDEVQGKPNVCSAAAENEGGQTGDFIIEGEELKMLSEVDDDDEEEEDDMEGVGGALGEQEMDVNMNTEELNEKFEEFIRKMKEELRIQGRQQLIAV